MYPIAGTVYISINSTVTHLYSHVVGIHYKVGIIYGEVSFAASTWHTVFFFFFSVRHKIVNFTRLGEDAISPFLKSFRQVVPRLGRSRVLPITVRIGSMTWNSVGT